MESRERVTPRAILIGLVLIGLVIEFIHQAELVLGGKGHTALANTSLPVGAFFALLVLLLLNHLWTRFAPGKALRRSELITIYVMLCTSTVIASSGGVHFLVPTIMAPRHFATPENRWEVAFFRYIPPWFAPTDPEVVRRFYEGHASVPYRHWLVPLAVWSLFLYLLLTATLCLAALLRRPWVDRERLTFPTVMVPLEVTRPKTSLWRNPLLWTGFGIAFGIGTLNTLNMNIPAVPRIQVRPVDISRYFVAPPWNALGWTPISFYPFVIGIAFLLSLEVTFSCWFFYWLFKLEMVLGAATGWRQPGAAGVMADFPFRPYQGAGAFLGLVAFSLWAGRGHWREVVRAALGLRRVEDSHEPLPFRAAAWGFVLSVAGMVLFAHQAGMSTHVALFLFLLSLAYMTAATRVRAETGNAWLFGPHVDPNTLMTRTFGSEGYLGRDLTLMAYFRSISTFDLRCLPMPHQLDAFKMAEAVHLSGRQLVGAIVLGFLVGIPLAFMLALHIWYDLGAAGKSDVWRTMMGKRPFDELITLLQQPAEPNWFGFSFTVGAFLFTLLLFALRAWLVAFPFHPVGYAIAGTQTMDTTWMPFFLAWLAKALILRYGGMRLYRATLPFFLGLIVGDFANGGLWTLVGILSGLAAYPMNW